MKIFSGGLFAVVAFLWCSQSFGAGTLPAGSVTMTRVHGDAVVIWDATDELTGLITKNTPRDQIQRTLEADAALVLISRAGFLKNKAKSLTVHVIYQSTGATSAQYRVPTFEGLTRLMSVNAQIAAALAHPSWVKDLEANKTPKGLNIVIVAKWPANL